MVVFVYGFVFVLLLFSLLIVNCPAAKRGFDFSALLKLLDAFYITVVEDNLKGSSVERKAKGAPTPFLVRVLLLLVFSSF